MRKKILRRGFYYDEADDQAVFFDGPEKGFPYTSVVVIDTATIKRFLRDMVKAYTKYPVLVKVFGPLVTVLDDLFMERKADGSPKA